MFEMPRAMKMLRAALDAGVNKGCKERVRCERLRLKFGMELATDEPGMIRNLDHLDVDAVRGAAGDAEACARERLVVFAVKFVAVAMALGDFRGSISALRERTGLELALP